VTENITEQTTEAVQSIALVQGTPFVDLPEDLYIPPDALEVFLDTFEGPLDLLLYLIRRQNLDILNIPIAHITTQYISYIEMMNELQLELAAEYLLMAALLAEIKSRMLLPRQSEVEDEEDDIELDEEDTEDELTEDEDEDIEDINIDELAEIIAEEFL